MLLAPRWVEVVPFKIGVSAVRDWASEAYFLAELLLNWCSWVSVEF
jgi:hypothetical protein